MSYSSILDGFISAIDGLENFFPAYSIHISKLHKQKAEEFLAFVKTNGADIKEENNRINFSLDPEYHKEFITRQRELDKISLSAQIIPQSQLVALVSQYDAFVGGLVQCIYEYMPEKLYASDKHFKYSELKTFSSIESFKQSLISKEIDSVLRKSHPEQLERIASLSGATLTSDRVILKKLVEITERRNLFVHSNGVITDQYITNCNKYGCDKKNSDSGKLYVNHEYFENAYETFYELAVKMILVIWAKTDKSDEPAKYANQISYDLITRERYGLAAMILEFCLQLFKSANSEINAMLALNLAQSYKWVGDIEKCESVVDSIDLSISIPRFKLVKEVLCENYNEATVLMRLMLADDSFDRSFYHEWPIFKEFVKTDVFKAEYKKLYNIGGDLIREEYSNSNLQP